MLQFLEKKHNNLCKYCVCLKENWICDASWRS